MRISVIGNGSAGRRHARILGAMGHHIAVLGPEVSSPVQHPPADAIVVASPPDTHKLYISWYHDKAHMLVEGPVTWLPPTSNKFVHAVAENWIWVPQVQAIKNKIGPCVHANFWFDYDLARWRPDIDYRTTCYYTSGIDLINLHSVMLPFYFFGSARKVDVHVGYTGKSLGVDTVGMVISHKSGTISTVNSSWHAAHFQFGFKMVMADGSTEEAWWTSPKDDEVANLSYEKQIDHWLEAIEGGDANVQPSLLDGYRAYQALQGVVV